MKKTNEKYIYITSAGNYRVQIRPNSQNSSGIDEVFEDKEVAKDERDKFLAKQKLGLDRYIDKNIGFSDYCDKYFEWFKNKPKKPKDFTLTDYGERIKNLKKHFKNKSLYKITSADIEECLMKESKRKKIH